MGLDYYKQVLKSSQQQATNSTTMQYLYASYKHQNSSTLNKSHILIMLQISAKHTSARRKNRKIFDFKSSSYANTTEKKD